MAEIPKHTYKLTYFPVKALAEPIRFLLSYGGIEFTDNRFNREDWPSIKPTTPFGQVPILEVNGKQLNQHVAICRLIAKKIKLNGANDLEDYEIDSTVDNINDLRGKLVAYHYEENPAVKEPKYEPLVKESIPFFLSRFDKIVGENNGYLCNKKLSWADLYFVAVLDYLSAMAKFDIIEPYANLKKLKETVLKIPSIQQWVQKRPETEF